NSALAELLKFAMISAFLAAPVFAWLNYGLVKQDKKHKLSPMMNLLAIVGLIYLVGFALLFVLNLLGVLA
ncbi:MAG: divalent metal cation transporter, partial [Neisseria sp.]